MTKINRVERITLFGGIIGSSVSNPRVKIENKCRELNAQGWHCHQIVHHGSRNLIVIILSMIVLILTLFLWTFGLGGYLLLFEKEVDDSENYGYGNNPGQNRYPGNTGNNGYAAPPVPYISNAPAEPLISPAPASTWVCNNCGAENNASLEFCTRCGTHI